MTREERREKRERKREGERERQKEREREIEFVFLQVSPNVECGKLRRLVNQQVEDCQVKS